MEVLTVVNTTRKTVQTFGQNSKNFFGGKLKMKKKKKGRMNHSKTCCECGYDFNGFKNQFIWWKCIDIWLIVKGYK